jgi:FAD/FMN-containing dehydrogenase
VALYAQNWPDPVQASSTVTLFGMDFKTRIKWQNDAKNQKTVPLRTYTPQSIDDLQSIVGDARKLGLNIRASGSRHSWSDAALPPDFAVLPTGLTQVIQPDHSILRRQHLAAGNALVEVESGITLHDLNNHLDANGLALPNMGGYDDQTIVGVTATSTHGTGLAFGPLTEIIRSTDVVDGMGNLLRVEPANGPSERVAFVKKHGASRLLIQDDQTFHALGVGLGSLALIYSVIIEVVPAFWLQEIRTLTSLATSDGGHCRQGTGAV